MYQYKDDSEYHPLISSTILYILIWSIFKINKIRTNFLTSNYPLYFWE